MPPILYRTTRPICLIGAGPVDPSTMALVADAGTALVAADGGADRAKALNRAQELQAVIGDLDSLSSVETWQESGVSVHAILEQYSTDFEKCLYSTEAPLYLAVGFLDGRVDHKLAVLNALMRYPDKRVVLIGSADLCFLAPEPCRIDLPKGSRFSLFPLRAVTGRASSGLRWPIDGLDLAPGGRVGTSNETTAERVEIAFDARGVLVILDRVHWRAAAAALGGDAWLSTPAR